MTKKNQQPATIDTAENLAMFEETTDKLLNFKESGPWIKFFQETATRLAFKASKFKNENETLLFYGRFFRSFIEKFSDLEETDEKELGAQLATKLIELSQTDNKRKSLKDAINGLKGRLKKLEEEATQGDKMAQQNAPKIKDVKNKIQELERELKKFSERELKQP